MPYQGGTSRLIKFFPFAENFFLSLTNDIFVICNLKVIKNNRYTYDNIHFEKKVAKKCSVYISDFVTRCRPARSSNTFFNFYQHILWYMIQILIVISYFDQTNRLSQILTSNTSFTRITPLVQTWDMGKKAVSVLPHSFLLL